MTIEDLSDGPHLSVFIQGGIGITVDGGQTIGGGGHVPKIRKPYTITKQRERWTEAEHGKFLEALKLYGRAWRKIEEHVGTKTAVQIRSHAQKFFSKVLHESNSCNPHSVEPIEIPPPRPKKKPMHPYPRKLALPTKGEMMVSLQEHPVRSTSPNSSVDQENQSPTSVLSAVVTETSGFADSNTLPAGSSSPVSCLPPEEDANMLENISQSDEPVSLKLEFFPNVDTNKGCVEATSMKRLKLFGKTVMVTDDDSPDLCFNKLKLEEGGSLVAPLSCAQGQQEVADLPIVNAQSSLSTTPFGVLPSVCYINANPKPMWALYGGLPYPFIPCDNHLMIRAEEPIIGCKPEDEVLEKENQQKEVSWSGSETGSVNRPGNGDVESQSHQFSLEFSNRENFQERFALRSKSGGNLEKRAKSENYTRGFVPYKRCLSAGETQSSTTTTGGDNRNSQRSWLRL